MKTHSGYAVGAITSTVRKKPMGSGTSRSKISLKLQHREVSPVSTALKKARREFSFLQLWVQGETRSPDRKTFV